MSRFSFALILAAAAALLLAGCCEPLPPKPTTPEPLPLEEEIEAESEVLTPEVEIPLVLLPSDSSKTVSLRFAFETGSAEDPTDKAGLGMLTARLMAEGGTESLTFPELIEKLFPMAAEIGLGVDRDQTVFFGRVHVEKLDEYYELIRDVLIAPRLEQQDFERVREQQRTYIAKTLRGNDDEELGKATLAWEMYAGHPYRHPPQGTEAGLAAITLDDVEQHRERTLCGSRLTVGIAGAIPDGFADRVREDMRQLPAVCGDVEELPEPPTAAGREVLIVDKPSAEATAISIGFPIAARRGSEDYPALKLIEAYFGQHRTFSGALQKSLRVERGFNYGNYAYVEHFEQEGWQRIPATNTARRQQYFSIWIRPVKEADKHFALRLALYELDRLVRDGITQEDLERTRAFMKRYYLTFAQTEELQLGYAIDDRYYGHDEPYLDMLFAGLDALTADGVNEVIEKYLTADDLFIGLVTKHGTAFKKALAADAESPVTYVAKKPAHVVEQDEVVKSWKLDIPEKNISIIGVNDIFE